MNSDKYSQLLEKMTEGQKQNLNKLLSTPWVDKPATQTMKSYEI